MVGEQGSISAEGSPVRPNWYGTLTGGKIPCCASFPLTITEATGPKEIQTLLKSGRDSNWTLKITVTSALDELTSLSITYDSDWKDFDGTIDWAEVGDVRKEGE
jgi:hypothetical protein